MVKQFLLANCTENI